MTSISEEELEREVRTLRNLRRRSGSSPGPGALPVDPDLPPRDAFSHDADGGPEYTSNDDVTITLPSGDAGLFWVPAHLHPELAPGEFRAFLKQHTQANPLAVEAGETGEAQLARSPSWVQRSGSINSNGLGRKKSMLSRQYTPRHGDKVEDETPPVPVRRSSMYGGRNADTVPTLSDLQKLDELVEEAEISDDPEKMRKLIRRSLSLSLSPGMMDDTVRGPSDEADTPIVVPRPGSIIRRTARTKIRKAGPGEGGSRRYSSSRPRRGFNSPSSVTVDSVHSAEDDTRRSDERRSDETSDERASSESYTQMAQSVSAPDSTESAGSSSKAAAAADMTTASDDSNDEALIFDAYARDRYSTASSIYDEPSRSPSPENDGPSPYGQHSPALPPILTSKPAESMWLDDGELTPTQDSGLSAAIHAMNLLPSSGPLSEDIFKQEPVPPRREPSSGGGRQQTSAPQSPVTSPTHDLPPGMAPPRHTAPAGMSEGRNGPVPPALVIGRPPLHRTDSASSSASASTVLPPPPVQPVAPAPPPTPPREKETKTKEKEKKGLFGKKHSKKEEKDKHHKKEKDRFLGSIFRSKPKQEEPSSVSNFATAGPAAAAALLGTSKSAKSLQPGSGASSPTSPGFTNYARYPIHVERAVYRLSHIKLANARRPLIEQVLISNLMFWYLGIIGRTTGQQDDKKPGSVNGLDKENREEAARQPQLKGTPSKPADTGSAGVKQSEPPTPPRKTGLNKPERARGNGNSAETAYRAPQYGMQNAQMELEKPQRTSSIPSAPHRTRSPPSPSHQQPQQQQQPQYPPGVAPPRPQSSFAPPQHGGGGSGHSQQQQQQQQHQPQQHQPPQHQPQQPQPRPPPGAQPAHPGGMSARPQGYPQNGVQRPSPQHYGQQQQAHAGPARAMSPPEQRHRTSPQPPTGAHPANPAGMPVRPQYAQNGSARQGSPSGAEKSRGYQQQSGPQPGQIFQYPGSGGGGGGYHQRPQGGAAPGQIYSGAPQPGQIFHLPHQQQMGYNQRPPQQGQPNWEPPQRLPTGGQRAPGPALAQAPPRGSSSNARDPYGRAAPHGYRQATSPTHQSFS